MRALFIRNAGKVGFLFQCVSLALLLPVGWWRWVLKPQLRSPSGSPDIVILGSLIGLGIAILTVALLGWDGVMDGAVYLGCSVGLLFRNRVAACLMAGWYVFGKTAQGILQPETLPDTPFGFGLAGVVCCCLVSAAVETFLHHQRGTRPTLA